MNSYISSKTTKEHGIDHPSPLSEGKSAPEFGIEQRHDGGRQQGRSGYSVINDAPVQRSGTNALPSDLQAGAEAVAGVPMNDVTVNYNSNKPRQMHADGLAQGTSIHLAPGKEGLLKHELGHIIQQKTTDVPTTATFNGHKINDDPRLERQADALGEKASKLSPAT